MKSDLVQHSGEIDQAFRLLIIGNRSLILHYTKDSRPVLRCQQTTLMPRTRPLHNVVEHLPFIRQIHFSVLLLPIPRTATVEDERSLPAVAGERAAQAHLEIIYK